MRVEQAKYDKLKEQVKLAEPNLEKISHWVRCHVKLREVLVERLTEGTQIHFTISTNPPFCLSNKTKKILAPFSVSAYWLC